jgi:hypothetical protein
MPKYSYADCLRNSYKVNWRVEDVLGDRRFDIAKRWLPESLSGTATVTCLDAEDQRLLTHVEMAAYAHLFGYVEEFIAPKVTELANEHQIDHREAFDALTNFAAEEVKHMMLFRETRKLIDQTLGFEHRLIGGCDDTARFVLSKSNAAVLLFTAVLEWLTQRHFEDAWRDDASLDAMTKRIFRAHWVEEAQHAKMDHLETLRAFATLDEAQADAAVDEVAELLTAVDGLLQQQAELDVANFETYRGATLDAADREQVYAAVLRAKRWTFIETGVTHPRVTELLEEITTPAQRARIEAALEPILGYEPACA